MSLRKIYLAGATAIVVVGASLAIMILVLATNLRAAAHEIATDIESLRISAELELALISVRDAHRPTARQGSEDLVRRLLGDAERYVTSAKERELLATLEQEIDLYLAAVESDTNMTPQALRDDTRDEFDGVVSAIQPWAQVNVDQSRALRDSAARWETSNIISVLALAILAIGLAALALWLQRRTFRPALQLVGTIDRYAKGDRAARASEQGPEELRTVAHRFNAMVEALEHQRQNQLAFLGGVAHDIRNPLAALKMSTSLIQPDEPLPPEPRVRQLFVRVDRQIDRLQRMVDDFLDASRVEAGHLELHVEVCDMRDLARATIDLLEPATRRHKLEVCAPEEPVSVTCDPMRIEQVLNNLVGNAIKYSPQGGEVRIEIAQRQEVVVLTVADDGVGMSADDVVHAFEPFHRASASKGVIPGVGLGLYVARKIVEAHGGRITVDSVLGSGSTFTVFIPHRGTNQR